MTLSLLVLIVAAFFLFVAGTNSVFWPRLRKVPLTIPATVSVLIPARNEEKNIAACLDTVIQQGSLLAEIIVYDDHSTDNTSKIVQSYAAVSDKVRVESAVPLPSGWCGKNFACAQLAKVAKGDWLLFLDADARLLPEAISRMVGEAQRRQATMLSCWPGFATHTLVEKILMPYLNFVVFSLYPGILTYLKQPEFQFNPKLGLAHGACMLFERESYHSFGGHERVKDQIFEDTRIAQLWRADQRTGLCLDGQDIVTLRMYSSFTEIWYGFQKNFFPAFSYEYNFWLFLLVHISVFLCPFILFVTYSNPLLAFTLLLVLMTRTTLLIRFRQSFFSLIFHPLGELLLVILGLSSWWRCKSGKGVVWKGRAYQKSA